MSVRQPNRNDPFLVKRDRQRRPKKVHLRVGKGTRFEGPACGADLSNASGKVDLTDNPAEVTCKNCLRLR